MRGETAAERAKRHGMSQVEKHANQLWMDLMVYLVWEVCLARPVFNADDVYDLYQAIPESRRPDTHEHRAMGPVMLIAAKEGLCKKANVPGVPSRRPSLHASPRTVWLSCVFEG